MSGPYRESAATKVTAQTEWRAAADSLRKIKGEWGHQDSQRDGLAEAFSNAAACVDEGLFETPRAAEILKGIWASRAWNFRQQLRHAEGLLDPKGIRNWRAILEAVDATWPCVERWLPAEEKTRRDYE